jgi:hypothetical protein
MDRTDAVTGPAEIQVVWALGPFSITHAEDLVAVRSLHVAQRTVATLPGAQAGKVVAALGSLPEYFRRNAEHYKNSPSSLFEL